MTAPSQGRGTEGSRRLPESHQLFRRLRFDDLRHTRGFQHLTDALRTQAGPTVCIPKQAQREAGLDTPSGALDSPTAFSAPPPVEFFDVSHFFSRLGISATCFKETFIFVYVSTKSYCLNQRTQLMYFIGLVVVLLLRIGREMSTMG